MGNIDLDELVKKNWTYEAKEYSNIVNKELNGEMPEVWSAVIDGVLSHKTGLDVLDIGTGPGFFPIIMSKLGHRVTGVDSSVTMLDEAKENLKRNNVEATLMCESADDLPFEAESFDCVINRNVAWTLSNPEKSYLEWLRVLKKGGKLIIFDANWNYQYFDEKVMEEYKKNAAEYRLKFSNNELDNHTKEGIDFRTQMPLCKVKRPEWDMNFFMECDISKIMCDFDIYKYVWDDARKLVYGATPMFMVVIEK